MSNSTTIQLRIVSPVGIVFDGETSYVVLPGEQSAFAVYPQHAPIISSLTKGVIKYIDKDNKECLVTITGGFVEVKNDMVTVCAELK